jgi:hypothetical protein
MGEAARGGERDIAVACGDIENTLVGPQVERLAQRFTDDLQGRADDGVIP